MNKRFVSGLAALAVVFSGAGALPAGTFEGFSLTASAAETYRDFKYDILDDGTVRTVRITGYSGSDEEVFIPSQINGRSVTSIGNYAFFGCKNFESITIPRSVTSIGYYAFWGCRSLASITIPKSVTSIGNNAFADCTSLASITIRNGVTSISDHAFFNCTSLESITISDSVTSIGESAFNRCLSLASITIPDSVISIGNRAFYECTSLTDITIPDSVTSIGNRAFADCTSLASVIIPNSVTSIDDEAFGYYYDKESKDYIKLDGFTIKGYKNTAAETYAKENGFEFIDLDGTSTTDKYPVVTSEVQGRQFRLKWTSVSGAEKYGLALYQSGKWRVKVQFNGNVTSYTSPKIKAGTYKMVLCAKVNGEWDTSSISKRAFTVTIA